MLARNWRIAFSPVVRNCAFSSSSKASSLPAIVLLPIRKYHENIVEHYENPRNVGSLDKTDDNVGTVSLFPCI